MKTAFAPARTSHWPSVALLSLILLSRSSAQDPFTRITSGAIVSGVNCTVLAWGDYNNDGFQDLFVSTRTGGSLLYSNNGNGTFSRVTTGPIPADANNCFGAAWGDYDNDGFLDLFVAVNNFGNDWLYHNNGNGSFTKITSGPVVSSGANGNNCSWADYDHDGFLDLWVANSDQNDFVYHNSGDGTFARVTTNAIALKSGNSQGGAWADYDEDGLPDLFVSRVNEPNLLYHNEGGGVFRPVTNGIIVHDVSVGQGTSWGDYDNDGHLDLFVVNPNAPNFLYHNNGDGTFTKITNGAVVTDIGNGHGCAWADYDNDGHLDLFVANRLGVNFLYHNSGTGTFARVTGGVVPTDTADAVSGAWADYDNDGFQDLFVTELGAFTNRLFHNNGNSNNWLAIRCEGRISNRSAIGAIVRVKATVQGKTLWQMRHISGGDGLGSQNDLRAAFGLGDAASADVVRIEWPSGIVQHLANVAARQFLTLVEPAAIITPTSAFLPAGTNLTLTLHTDLEPPLQVQWNLNGTAIGGETNGALSISSVQRADTGSYTVSITNTATGLYLTTRAATVGGAASIMQQPLSQNVRVGSNVIFSVVATGFPPLLWQWRKNGTNLAGGTNATLAVTNVQLGDEGNYSVVVANSYGDINSSNAELIALIRPAITVHPVSQSVVEGGSVTLSASATGHPMPLTFRWLTNGAIFSSMTVTGNDCFFTVTNVRPPVPPNQLAYRVLVTNLAGNVSSVTANLTVLKDTDRDGLPDEWELAQSLNPNDPGDAALDNDADGATNGAEYVAGTNPNDGLNFLRLTSVRGENASVKFRLLAISNHTYTVEACTALAAGSWRAVTDVTASAMNRTIEIAQPTGTGATQHFFRVVSPRASGNPPP